MGFVDIGWHNWIARLLALGRITRLFAAPNDPQALQICKLPHWLKMRYRTALL
jgi:hypothetical protein